LAEPEISQMPQIRGWAGRRGMGRVGGWVNDVFRHRRASCVHSGPDRWPQQTSPYHEESRH